MKQWSTYRIWENYCTQFQMRKWECSWSIYSISRVNVPLKAQIFVNFSSAKINLAHTHTWEKHNTYSSLIPNWRVIKLILSKVSHFSQWKSCLRITKGCTTICITCDAVCHHPFWLQAAEGEFKIVNFCIVNCLIQILNVSNLILPNTITSASHTHFSPHSVICSHLTLTLEFHNFIVLCDT